MINFACYQQPPENFPFWKNLGCQWAIGPERGNPVKVQTSQWVEAARKAGLKVVGNPQTIIDQYSLVDAFICSDEPNETNHVLTQPPSFIADQVQQFKKMNNSVPILLNLAGDRLTSSGPADNKLHEDYIKAVGDGGVVLADWYPVNREFAHYPLTFKQQEMTYLKARGAKFLGSFIETDWQWLNNGSPKGRAPTPDEVEKQIRLAVDNGASWIVFFSTTQSGHWGWPQSYNTTTDDVAKRIKDVIASYNGMPVPPTQPTNQMIYDEIMGLKTILKNGFFPKP